MILGSAMTSQNFFRRAGFYLNVFEGKDIYVERDFENYVHAFQKQEVHDEVLDPS